MIRLDGTMMRLEGHCPVEEAEELLEKLQSEDVTALHLGDCQSLHTAVFQLVRASNLRIVVAPPDPFLTRLLPAIKEADADGLVRETLAQE